jgi:NTP pyrophosphatase (non-canonical NTP hydrolase)
MQIDLNKYQEFVEGVTSDESNSYKPFTDSLLNLNDKCNIALLLTAGIGLASETGEFNEIVKKMVFQGKELTDDVHFHMKRELGDIMWYWINACRALALDPNDVIAENVNKLKARYPGGEFNAYYSENRKEGDL